MSGGSGLGWSEAERLARQAPGAEPVPTPSTPAEYQALMDEALDLDRPCSAERRDQLLAATLRCQLAYLAGLLPLNFFPGAEP